MHVVVQATSALSNCDIISKHSSVITENMFGVSACCWVMLLEALLFRPVGAVFAIQLPVPLPTPNQTCKSMQYSDDLDSLWILCQQQQQTVVVTGNSTKLSVTTRNSLNRYQLQSNTLQLVSTTDTRMKTVQCMITDGGEAFMAGSGLWDQPANVSVLTRLSLTSPNAAVQWRTDLTAVTSIRHCQREDRSIYVAVQTNIGFEIRQFRTETGLLIRSRALGLQDVTKLLIWDSMIYVIGSKSNMASMEMYSLSLNLRGLYVLDGASGARFTCIAVDQAAGKLYVGGSFRSGTIDGQTPRGASDLMMSTFSLDGLQRDAISFGPQGEDRFVDILVSGQQIWILSISNVSRSRTDPRFGLPDIALQYSIAGLKPLDNYTLPVGFANDTAFQLEQNVDTTDVYALVRYREQPYLILYTYYDSDPAPATLWSGPFLPIVIIGALIVLFACSCCGCFRCLFCCSCGSTHPTGLNDEPVIIDSPARNSLQSYSRTTTPQARSRYPTEPTTTINMPHEPWQQPILDEKPPAYIP